MVLVGVPLGILSARYRDGLTDNIARVVALLGVVTPTFVWAIFLMLLFSFALDLLPTIGRLGDGVAAPPGSPECTPSMRWRRASSRFSRTR